jgi:hypothetical protein
MVAGVKFPATRKKEKARVGRLRPARSLETVVFPDRYSLKSAA